MKTITFVKMNGLGNDFVLIDAIKSGLEPEVNVIKSIANRHLGVGCDQVLWLQSATAGIKYRIFNPDGTEVAQCGNGARCVGHYMAKAHNYKDWPLQLNTCAGQKLLVSQANAHEFTVSMGAAQIIERKAFMMFASYELSFQALDIGNPHAVFWLEQSVTEFDLLALGSAMQQHKIFPQGVNVSIVNRLADDAVIARVYERGAEETLACGSAACAVAASGYEQGILHGEIKVNMPGGQLIVVQKDGVLHQTGPVNWVFVGTWCQRQQSHDVFYFDVD